MANNENLFVEVTKRFRQKDWPDADKWAVISMDHAGNPIGLDQVGKVWISDHEEGAVQVLANDFETYLRKKCLNLNA